MAEPKFIPRPDQIDFTKARYAPVMNTVIVNKDRILLVHRSKDLKLYPGYWNGISGFLDDKKDIQEKISEEFSEELGLTESSLYVKKIGRPFLQDATEYQKTWLVVPVLVETDATEFKLDWEAQEAKWFKIAELKKINLMPGYDKLVKEFFPDFKYESA